MYEFIVNNKLLIVKFIEIGNISIIVFLSICFTVVLNNNFQNKNNNF